MKNVLSPISETNINMNAAANPDFAIAAKIEEGPPFTNMIKENTKALPNNTIAIERGYGIRLGRFSVSEELSLDGELTNRF